MSPDQIKYTKYLKEEIFNKRPWIFPKENLGMSFIDYCAYFRLRYKKEYSNFSIPGYYELDSLNLFKDNIVGSNWLISPQNYKLLITILQIDVDSHICGVYSWDDDKIVINYELVSISSEYFLNITKELEKFNIHKEKTIVSNMGFGGFSK